MRFRGGRGWPGRRGVIAPLAALFFAAVLTAGEPLVRTIEAIIASSEEASQGFWGVHVMNSDTGRTAASINGDRYFVPASSTKLFTTALALQELGPDYRFLTRVDAEGEIDAAGLLRGNLVLVGMGDPTLSGRHYPYSETAERGDPLEPLRALARQLHENGLREVSGDLVGDDTAYIWDPYPPGWAESDVRREYGAAVSALTFNDNSIRLLLLANEETGEPEIRFDPAVDYYSVSNRMLTQPGSGRPHIVGVGQPRELILGGGMDVPARLSVAVDDPALFAAFAFRQVLAEEGIAVRGVARARHRLSTLEPLLAPAGPTLATRQSPPLIQILQTVNKASQNLHAELLLREVGRMAEGHGTRAAGFRRLAEFLTALGIGPDEIRFSDGSGLSRLDLVTPRAVTGLLAAMWNSPHRQAWLETLAVGGQEGTLAGRLQNVRGADRIRAKTGTLTHVTALSGYVLPREDSGTPKAFSIIVNNTAVSGFQIRKLIDTICLELLK